MVRERVEDREERALGDVSRQVQQAKGMAERLREEILGLLTAETQRLGALSSGAEIRQQAVEMDCLKQREAEAVAEWQGLEERRLEQLEIYRAAHADCEAIAALQEQRRAAYAAALQMRERKAGEELFLGRRTMKQQRLAQEIAGR